MYPVKPKITNIKKCGNIQYKKKNGKIILDYKAAKCYVNALKQCGRDRKVLILANKSNIRQINRANKQLDSIKKNKQ